jgi:ABC-type nitrate/sulfonate/bicarbonate transport system substrate-binding protein
MGEPGASLVHQQLPNAPVLADFTKSDRLMDLLGTRVYPGSSLFSTATWVRSNTDTVRKLTRSLSRATSWAKARTPAEILHKVNKYLGPANPEIMAEAVGNMLPNMSSTGRTSPEAAEAVARLTKVGTRINQSYTNEFASTQSR